MLRHAWRNAACGLVERGKRRQQRSSDATGLNGAQDNDARGNSGAVYLFELGAAGWQQAAYVKAVCVLAKAGGACRPAIRS